MTSCTGTASEVTKEHMRLYRQCVLRTQRNVGKFKVMSDEVFNAMVCITNTPLLSKFRGLKIACISFNIRTP